MFAKSNNKFFVGKTFVPLLSGRIPQVWCIDVPYLSFSGPMPTPPPLPRAALTLPLPTVSHVSFWKQPFGNAAAALPATSMLQFIYFTSPLHEYL